MTEPQAIRPTRRPRRQVLTDKMVAALPRRPQAYFHPDPALPKFGIRIRPNGPGAYTVITRDPFKKQRWTKVGSTAELTIDEARAKAREVIKRVEAGTSRFQHQSPGRRPWQLSLPLGCIVMSRGTSCGLPASAAA